MFYIEIGDNFAYFKARPDSEFHKVVTALCQKKNISATAITGFQLPNGCFLNKTAIGMNTLETLGITPESVLTLMTQSPDA
jgi:hypothetical protein